MNIRKTKKSSIAGSSRHSSRNVFVAKKLNEHGLGTLLFDLLSSDEEIIDMQFATLRFDIDFLAKRVMAANLWLKREESTADLKIGYFGASTGAAAALVAAAEQKTNIGAIVSRGGRPDLASKNVLRRVSAPSLFLVGANDKEVLELNQQAVKNMTTKKELRVIPNAGHLFEEPGRLEIVADFASRWFAMHLI